MLIGHFAIAPGSRKLSQQDGESSWPGRQKAWLRIISAQSMELNGKGYTDDTKKEHEVAVDTLYRASYLFFGLGGFEPPASRPRIQGDQIRAYSFTMTANNGWILSLSGKKSDQGFGEFG